MPKITVNHNSRLSAVDALDKIKTFFETDMDLKKIDPELKCDFRPDDLSGKVNGKQFKAEIKAVSVDTGSNISVIIDLPLMLTPFKGKVEETVKKKLSRYLA